MNFFKQNKEIPNQSLGVIKGHSLFIKREDLLHPNVSGNKFRKLKYIFEEIVSQKVPVVATFGGAFSNHLSATAAIGKELGLKTIGFVRGEEWQNKIESNSTLSYCHSQKMKLVCISRQAYTKKESSLDVIKILKQFPKFRLIPEGGSEILGVKGCSEILTIKDLKFDVICTSVGSGGTIAGLIKSSSKNQKVLGFNALKNPSVNGVISTYTRKKNWEINSNFIFGGFAKTSPALIKFINSFYQKYQIPLDPIYTGKMLFAIFELIKNNQWRWGKKILAIHTGGLQGVTGINQKLKKKKSQTLLYSEDLLY